MIVSALKNFGKQYNIASMQAMRADRYRKSTKEEVAFMEGDDLDDEHLYGGYDGVKGPYSAEEASINR